MENNLLVDSSAKIMLHAQKIKLESNNNNNNNTSKTSYILFSGEEPYKIGLFNENEVNVNGCGFLLPNNYLMESIEFYISSSKDIVSETDMKIKIQLYLAKEGSIYYPLEKAKLEIDLGKKILRTDFIEKNLKIENLFLNRLSKVITVASFTCKEERKEEFFIGGTVTLSTINN